MHRHSDPTRFIYSDEVLDDLPFPINHIAGNRYRLCDYCFLRRAGIDNCQALTAAIAGVDGALASSFTVTPHQLEKAKSVTQRVNLADLIGVNRADRN